MIKDLLRQIKFFITHRNNSAYCKYLREGGVKIGKNVNFRYPAHTVVDLTRPTLVELGSNLDINDNFSIMTHDFGTYVFRNLYDDFVSSSGKVIIGNNIYFGRNVTILKGVTIGDNCIIGAGSLVTKDIPSNSVACGAPAKVICSIEDYYKKRKEKSVEEALEYGVSIANKRTPIITDFKEEWSLFFRKEDFDTYPEMHGIIDWRLKDRQKSYWENHKAVFDGFELFMEEVNKRLKCN